VHSPLSAYLIRASQVSIVTSGVRRLEAGSMTIVSGSLLLSDCCVHYKTSYHTRYIIAVEESSSTPFCRLNVSLRLEHVSVFHPVNLWQRRILQSHSHQPSPRCSSFSVLLSKLQHLAEASRRAIPARHHRSTKERPNMSRNTDVPNDKGLPSNIMAGPSHVARLFRIVFWKN
jgi:hypothetical protein